jgi:glutathione S-transferase
MYSSLSKAVYPLMGFAEKTDQFESDVTKFHEKLQFLNNHLVKGKYLTGDDITIADISMAMSLSMLKFVDPAYLDKYSKVNDWINLMKARG